MENKALEDVGSALSTVGVDKMIPPETVETVQGRV